MIEFSEFLAAVRTGRRPYPWQETFAESAAGDGPPEVVAMPTGTGKTTVVEALVWGLAAQAHRPALERTVGARLVWAIDRRILVDEVFDQASTLANRLDEAWSSRDESDPLYRVAARLQQLKCHEGMELADVVGRPLEVTRWRGGVAIPSPAHHPMQAEVITSTVAQIGSRLFFRGYGLGAGSLPVGAALAACDTTICLDEAHLAEPFAATVAAIMEKRRAEESPVAPGVFVVRLTATPTDPNSEESKPLRLSPADEDALAERLQARKIARLVDPPGTTDRDQEQALTGAVDEHLKNDARVIVCVCNSVRIARAVFDQVRKANDQVDAMLLIGPQRPADREAMFDKVTARQDASPDTEDGAASESRSGTSAEPGPTRREVLFSRAVAPRPLIVVATQTIEVGLDVDVDAMVTQSASAAALVQRLGRLNRAGGEGRVGRATIVRHTEFPLYVEDEPLAWEWLNDLPVSPDGASIDVSIPALADPPQPVRIGRAPDLTDATVELLTQTSPRPHEMSDPDIEPFLRGIDSDPANDVSICWRSDLCETETTAAADTYRDALLRLAPPLPEEQLTVSVVAARNLLRSLTGASRARGTTLSRQVLDGGDIEGSAPNEVMSEESDSVGTRDFEGIPFFVRRGPNLLRAKGARDRGAVQVSIGEIRPGDLIILPAAIGGVDEFGLAPGARPDAAGERDVAADLRTGAEPGVDPIRITLGALELAMRRVHPDPGPRAQRIGRMLRRTAKIDARLDMARGDARRRQALSDLVAELSDHPSIAGLGEGKGDLDFDRLDLRRLTPAIPAELLEIEDENPDLDSGRDDLFMDTDEADSSPDSDGGMVMFEDEEEPMRAEGWVLVRVRGSRSGDDRLRLADGGPPTIEDHCVAVASRVWGFARAAGLDRRFEDALELAARAHDLGKAYRPMQSFFYGGVLPPLADQLAKSIFGTDDRRADRHARSVSGMPSRWRHELASAAVLANAWENGAFPEHLKGADRDLVLHLIISHHGKAHPLPPVPDSMDSARSFLVSAAGVTGTATGDGQEGWDNGAALQRRAMLTERYGPWGLAYLESLLILADRAVSAEGN